MPLVPRAVVAADSARDDPAVIQAAAERATYGLPSDLAYVRGLMNSSRDIGSSLWGIVLTREEEAAIDLPRRMAFAATARQELLPFATSLGNFGGAYIDQQRGGTLVIQLTHPDPDAEKRIFELAPDGGAVEVVYVLYRLADLEDAAQRVRSEWHDTGSVGTLHTVGIDEEKNLLELGVESLDDRSAAVATQLESVLSVSVEFTIAEAATDDFCATRDSCYNPMPNGIRIRKGSTTGGICTMAFHVRHINTGKREFVTAGHCGHTGPNDWYHAGYGYVGINSASQLVSPGRDIRRVTMPSSQADDRILGHSGRIKHMSNPIQGEAICASLGSSEAWDCGTVLKAHHSWTSSTCQCPVVGAQHKDIAIQSGDSGSPIVVLLSATTLIGVGVHNNSQGGFARFADAMNYWTNWALYTTN